MAKAWLARVALTFVLAGGGTPLPARPFELPGLGVLLGTNDPLAAFPDTLPPVAGIGLGLDSHEFYRSQRGPRLHDYDARSLWSLALGRMGPAWFGARYGREHMHLLQNEVYKHHDALDGGRNAGHTSAAFAYRRGGWETRALVGGSDGPEGAVQLTGALGPLARLEARAWRWRSGLELSQRLEGTTFFFPFVYRDENAELGVTTRPLAGQVITLRARSEAIVGEKLDPAQYNVLYIPRWRGEARVQRTRSPRLDLTFLLDRATFDLALALDGTQYLEAHDMRVRRWGSELGWMARRSLRLALGVDRWTLQSDDPSRADVWPFSVWDVFLASRYRLEAMDKHWQATYACLGWKPAPWRGLALQIDGRFEWWRDSGILRWTERVPVVWPFFFRLDAHERSLDWRLTHGVQMDAAVAWRPRPGVELRVGAGSVLPFGGAAPKVAEPGPPPPPPAVPEPKQKSRGGLRLNTALWLRR